MSKTVEPLTFDDVRRANWKRCQKWHPGFPNDDSWSGADWSNAMCGEAGELANVVKKLRRIETGHDPNPLKPEQDQAWLKEALADECADVFLYLDLLAIKYGVDLPAAIIRKFNAVSERQGFPDRLGSEGAEK